MEVSRTIRRGLAAVTAAAGVAYPACAAVCPRGWGGCPYPGRCFLFVDKDANSLCDYTTPATSPVTDPSAGQVTVSTTSGANSTAQTVLPRDPGLLQGLLANPVISGILSGIVLFALFFIAFRRGWFGYRIRETRHAVAASALFALGGTSIVSFVIAGEATAAPVYASVYLIFGSLLAGYLWKSGMMSRKMAAGTLLMSTLIGFVLVAPLMPLEFVGIVSIATAGLTVTPGIIGILGGIGLSLVFGRIFCGHLCPVGSVQELAWNLPVKKIAIRTPGYLEIARAMVFGAAVIGGLFLFNIMEFTGVYAFFTLAISAGLVTFLVILAVSAVIYRPLCRAICPFGLLFSLPSHFSRYRLTRTSRCIGCRKCERICPAGTAGKDAPKRECYLCARCTGTCPVPGALVYGSPGDDPGLPGIPDSPVSRHPGKGRVTPDPVSHARIKTPKPENE